MAVWILRRSIGMACLVSLLTLVVGCKKNQGADKEEALTVVEYQYPVMREVTDYEEFTGRTDARYTVDIRSRVTGYLNQARFPEGKFVKKGELLFQIDPRTYKADLDRAEAQLHQVEATQTRLTQDYQRARSLVSTRSISREEVDRISGNRSEAEASVASARAAVESAKLNLGFTTISSPLYGKISRRLVDEGNLVKADDTLLTTIVSLDPIYAYFDIDERTVLRLRGLTRDGKRKSASETGLEVKLGLANEEGFSLKGKIDFADPRLDPGTGTLRVRTVIDNKDLFLSPGMFLRMQLPVSVPEKMPVVPEIALGSDQGQKFVLVVVEDGEDEDEKTIYKVEHRRIEVGQLQDDGMRAVKKGVTLKDRIIVAGQQKVRAGKQVAPRLAETKTKRPTKPAAKSSSAG